MRELCLKGSIQFTKEIYFVPTFVLFVAKGSSIEDLRVCHYQNCFRQQVYFL